MGDMHKPTLRDALAPIAVGVAGALGVVLAELAFTGDAAATAVFSGFAAWLTAFAITGRSR